MTLEKPVSIPDKMFFKIGEVADIVDVKPHVLRYWETEFRVLNPAKTNSQQRQYSKSDVENLLLIKQLLYSEKYSIEGARRRLNELKHSSGGLKEARKVKVGIDPEKLESIKAARRELEELLALTI